MLSKLFPRWSTAKRPPLPQPDAQLALGALLVRVALADRSYKAEEVAAIDRILSQTFNLKPLEAAKLRATCEDLELHAPDTGNFARLLHDEVPYAERLALAHAMWQVVLADGHRVEIEEQTLHAIEGVLGLSAEDSAAAQAKALGD